MDVFLDRLRPLVAEALEITGRDPYEMEVVADTFLPDLMDSLSMTALLGLIEEEWDLEIADEDLDPADLEDPVALRRLIERTLHARKS